MDCERCSADEVRFRVYSDIISLIVCTSCAMKARKLGLAVEAPPKLRTDRQPGDVLDGDQPLNSAA